MAKFCSQTNKKLRIPNNYLPVGNNLVPHIQQGKSILKVTLPKHLVGIGNFIKLEAMVLTSSGAGAIFNSLNGELVAVSTQAGVGGDDIFPHMFSGFFPIDRNHDMEFQLNVGSARAGGTMLINHSSYQPNYGDDFIYTYLTAEEVIIDDCTDEK